MHMSIGIMDMTTWHVSTNCAHLVLDLTTPLPIGVDTLRTRLRVAARIHEVGVGRPRRWYSPTRYDPLQPGRSRWLMDAVATPVEDALALRSFACPDLRKTALAAGAWQRLSALTRQARKVLPAVAGVVSRLWVLNTDRRHIRPGREASAAQRGLRSGLCPLLGLQAPVGLVYCASRVPIDLACASRRHCRLSPVLALAVPALAVCPLASGTG